MNGMRTMWGVWLTLLLLLGSAGATAQLRFFSEELVGVSLAKDTPQDIRSDRARAVGMVLATNGLVWSFDRFVAKSDFAYINWQTIKRNFRTGFVWDNDMFITNLFMHPYHGGVYFNAARSNGMNFYQSLPYTVGGSLMWEFCMENEYPSINDLLATSIGGASLGEMNFRLSDRLVDDRTRGWQRLGREALLFVVSPARGASRLITGKAWKHRTTRGNALPSTPVQVYAAMGHRVVADYVNRKNDVSGMFNVDLGVYYGNPYDEDNEKPYDYFSLNFSGSPFSSQPFLGRVNAIGMLYSDFVENRLWKSRLAWGIYQHFNYYESKSDINHKTLTPYKLAEAASLGPGLLYEWKVRNKASLFMSAYVSAILLGCSQTDHYFTGERDYNMGSGFSSKWNMDLTLSDQFSLSTKFEDYRIYSWLGYDPNNPKLDTEVQGDKGKAQLTVARFILRYIVKKRWMLSVESSAYFRKSRYDYYPDVDHGVLENKINLGCLF
jgi:hypothetical protein